MKRILLSCIIFSGFIASAQDALDPSFGGDGIVTLDFGGNDIAYAVLIQPDGKILAAGQAGIGPALTTDIAIARYNTDGTLDPVWGGDGTVTLDLGVDYSDFSFALARQPDSKIVVAGCGFFDSGYKFAVLRYRADGSLDPAFSDDGIFITDFGGMDDWARAVYVMPDGKIVASGYRNDGLKHNFAIIRLTPEGDLDPTFGDGGKVYTVFPVNRHDQSYALAVQPDGKMILAGYSYVGTTADYQFALARYNEDGSLDDTFGDAGLVLTPVPMIQGESYAMELQPDGKILVSGFSYTDWKTDIAIIRFNSDGSVDTEFGTDGLVKTDIATDRDDHAYAMYLLADGRFLVGGNRWNGYDWDMALLRYNADGSLDNTFSGNGMLTIAIGDDADCIQAIDVQSDGKIVVAGYSDNGPNNDFALVRFMQDGGSGVGISNQVVTANFSISPNPGCDNISINCTLSGIIDIVDMQGHVVERREVVSGDNTIDIHQLPTANYIIRWRNESAQCSLPFIKK